MIKLTQRDLLQLKLELKVPHRNVNQRRFKIRGLILKAVIDYLSLDVEKTYYIPDMIRDCKHKLIEDAIDGY